MNVDKVCKFILNNLFLIAPNIKIACVNKDTTDHFHNCLKSVKIISLDIGICRIGREVLTCCAIGWAALCREWVVCRADKCLESSRASLSAADTLRPAFLYNNITNQRQWSGLPVIIALYFSFQNYDLMSEFWCGNHWRHLRPKIGQELFWEGCKFLLHHFHQSTISVNQSACHWYFL